MKKRFSELQKKVDLKKITPFPNISSWSSSFSPLPVSWLISSILFFFIVSVVAPVFWPQLYKVDLKTTPTTLNIILGIAGILVYILEPVIWHNNIYAGENVKADTDETDKDKNESWFSLIASLIITTAIGILVAMPYVAVLIFKPIFRAMILYVSLSFLNFNQGDTGSNPIFVFFVTADILLYYLGMIVPKWKFNPVNAIVKFLKINNRPLARSVGSILLIIHTALIYALLLGVVYYDIGKHPEKLNLKFLAMWWLFLTVYTRMSFITDDFEPEKVLRSMSRRDITLNILTIVISFISFIWPFYFS